MQAYKTFLEDTIFFFLFQFQFSSSRSHLLASFHLVRVSSKFYKTRHTLQLNKYKQTKICKKNAHDYDEDKDKDKDMNYF